MQLSEARTKEEILRVYQEKQLNNTQEKIDFLRKAMKIRSSRGDVDDTPEEELLSLEELVLTHYWEGLHAQ